MKDYQRCAWLEFTKKWEEFRLYLDNKIILNTLLIWEELRLYSDNEYH